jgi:glutathione S-transferase
VALFEVGEHFVDALSRQLYHFVPVLVGQDGKRLHLRRGAAATVEDTLDVLKGLADTYGGRRLAIRYGQAEDNILLRIAQGRLWSPLVNRAVHGRAVRALEDRVRYGAVQRRTLGQHLTGVILRVTMPRFHGRHW